MKRGDADRLRSVVMPQGSDGAHHPVTGPCDDVRVRYDVLQEFGPFLNRSPSGFEHFLGLVDAVGRQGEERRVGVGADGDDRTVGEVVVVDNVALQREWLNSVRSLIVTLPLLRSLSM